MGKAAADLRVLPPQLLDRAVTLYNSIAREFEADGLRLAGSRLEDVPHVMTPAWRVAEGIARHLRTLAVELPRGGSSPRLEAACSNLTSYLGRPMRRYMQLASALAACEEPGIAEAAATPRLVDATLHPHECLLLMPCGDRKLSHAARVDQLYQGSMWQTLRKHAPVMMPRLAVLSAEHGFLAPDQIIEPYEREMTPEREASLLELGLRTLTARLTGELDISKPVRDVQIVGGVRYRRIMRVAVADLQERGYVTANAAIRETDAKAIGLQRKQLGVYLREVQGLSRRTSPVTRPRPFS